MKIDREQYNYQPPKTGLWLLQALIVVLFIILCARFWYLQVLRGQEFVALAEANRTRTEKIFAPRGVIFDRTGKELAENSIIFDLAIVREDCPDVEGTIAKVAIILGVEEEELSTQYNEARTRASRFSPIPILKDMKFEDVAKIESHSVFLPGLQIQTKSRRYYPDADAFAHVLGYVAEANEKELNAHPILDMGDDIGKQGLELTLEDRLRGVKGEYKNQHDALGKILSKDLQELSKPGESITLSLDADLQHKIIEIMGDYSGAVIVMNPHNGELLAAVTLPSYDNNLFVRGLSYAEWDTLSNDDRYPLQNRAIQSVYPPASVWKLVMSGMLLKHGINPNKTVFCSGSITIGNNTFRCWHRGGHGNMNMRTAIMNSCDVYFYEMGTSLGIDNIAEYAKACGFGQLTGIEVPNEKAGLVPTKEWKLERFKEKWQGGETANVSIGQGQTLVTPLQVAVYFSSLINGGKILKPQILLNAETEVKSLNPASDEHRELLKKYLIDTATLGTARIVSQGNTGITIGAKTGTAQVLKLQMDGTRVKKNAELERKYRDHAWIASFAQYEGKDFVVITMLEHGGSGSSNAGPVTRDIIHYLYRDEIAAQE